MSAPTCIREHEHSKTLVNLPYQGTFATYSVHNCTMHSSIICQDNYQNQRI